MVRRTVDLPQPDGPEKAQDVAGIHGERHVAHHLAAIELAADAVDLEAWGGGHGANDRSFQSDIAAIRPHRTGKKQSDVTAGRRSITVSARMRPLT
jgi:hypothetical protein